MIPINAAFILLIPSQVGSSSTRSVPTESTAWIDQSKLNPNVPSYSDSLFSNMPGRSQPPLQYQPQRPAQRSYDIYQGRWQTQQQHPMPAQPQLQQQTRHYSELPHSHGAQYTQGPTANIATRSLPQSHISGHICELCLIVSAVQHLTFLQIPVPA